LHGLNMVLEVMLWFMEGLVRVKVSFKLSGEKYSAKSGTSVTMSDDATRSAANST
jgi:hypothetical protein